MMAILLRIATFSIPVPVALLVAGIGAYKVAAWYDKMKAIDAAITHLVAGAEIEALKAKAIAADRRAAAAEALAKDRQTQIDAEKRALAEFQAAAQENEQELKDQIDDALSTPAPDRCIAPDSFIDKLRNK